MDEMWNNAIKKAIAKENLTTKELAEKLNKNEVEIEKLISGDGRISLDDLYELCDLLQLDLNTVFDLPDKDIEILLTDELQAQVNEIARTIPESKRPYFLRALLYLAQCFQEL